MATEAPFDASQPEDVAAYVSAIAGGGPRLETRIHPSDEMYRFVLSGPHPSQEGAAILYFATGRQIFDVVAAVVAWRFREFGAVGSLLDFASGYGRSTRFLIRELGPRRITVAEIDPAAVAFQQEVFGVRGVVSALDPGSLGLEGSFDVILASSFFSHLPAARFEAWMARLHGLVAPGGTLIFSVHGARLLESDLPQASGILFRPVSETRRLDGAEYGTSYVTPEYVAGLIGRVTGGQGRLLAFPHGFCGYQDLYVLLRPPLPAGPDLRLSRVPRGVLEHSAVEGGVVSADGWAEGDSDERPPDVKLYFGESVKAISAGEGAPGSRRRWNFTFPASAVHPDRVVRIQAESTRGVSQVLAAATLRPYLPAPSA